MSVRSRGLFLPARDRVLWGIALYTALGLAWIVASDALVGALSSDPAWIEKAQHYKGVLYVLLTAGGLLLLVHSGHVQLLRTIEQARQDIERQDTLFQQLHRSLGEVLWLASPDDKELLYLSPAFESLYGRPRGDLYEVAILEETLTVENGELFCAYMVDNQAIVIPETIDAIRALIGLERDAVASMAKTNRALAIAAC